jgi:hypothetical protein
MSMLTHRLQIVLDEECYVRVRALARQRGKSDAVVIREALDRDLPATQPQRSRRFGPVKTVRRCSSACRAAVS